ncbi:MAG: PstS family phosphate ABC transporter substrate-binding protein [Candidatus Bathyarchaeia archaeon]
MVRISHLAISLIALVIGAGIGYTVTLAMGSTEAKALRSQRQALEAQLADLQQQLIKAGGTLQPNSIVIQGSDTMLILAQRWAEEYLKTHPELNIAVTGGGSGTGIAALIDGRIDLATASRPMKQSEIDAMRSKVKTPVQFSVALDGVSIIVHPSNPVKELTIKQLALIYTGNYTNWSQVGGPDLKITVYGRQSTSGTYAFFREHVMGNKDYRADMQSLPGNSDLVQAVSQDPSGIAYVGVAYAERRTDVAILAIKKDAASPSVKPTIATIKSGEYSISRPLYIITAGYPEGKLAAFIAWILSPEGQGIAAEEGYVPIV